MTKVILNEEQQKFKIIIEKNLAILTDQNDNKLSPEARQSLFKEMAQAAHSLHKSVTPTPKHHSYMIKNRGLEPDDINFYMHIHPVEDLLAFLENIHANDDPEDQTLGKTFNFKIYTRRWGHHDSYKLTRTEAGWHLKGKFGYLDGDCSPNGQPYIFKMLEHDFVNYPNDIGGYLEYLWSQSKEQGLSQSKVQESIDELSRWIEICESSTPKGIFKGYN